MMEQIKGLVRLEVERVMSRRKHNRNAVVTSVDPDTYSAKVRYEPHDPNDPDNAESGWIPIQAMATGQGYGMYSLPKVGHPVEVAFDQGDHETGRIVQRHASEQHQPPKGMKEGEHWIVHETGSAIKFAQDGTVSLLGAGSIPNRQGKDASTGKDGTSQQNQQPDGKQTFTVSPDGSFVFAHKAGGQIAMDKDGNAVVKTNGKNITVDAGSGSVTHKAKSHSFQGDLAVTGGISASGSVTASGTVTGATVTNGTKTL